MCAESSRLRPGVNCFAAKGFGAPRAGAISHRPFITAIDRIQSPGVDRRGGYAAVILGTEAMKIDMGVELVWLAILRDCPPHTRPVLSVDPLSHPLMPAARFSLLHLHQTFPTLNP